MKLGELVAVLENKSVSGNLDTEITNITASSSHVQPDALFICLKGLHFDGHNFIEQAVKSGARALLVCKDIQLSTPNIAIIKIPDTKKAIGPISARFYDYPSSKITIIGITGTNGKTTTTYLTEAVLKKANLNVSRLSTIDYKIGDKEESSWQTTPEALELQGILYKVVESGSSHLVMEVSSHGLALFRTLGCEFDIGVFTNLSQDHLDFHLNMEDYFKAKLMLFESLGTGAKKDFPKRAVINVDDPYSQRIISCLKDVSVITYGIKNPADIFASNIDINQKGCSFFYGHTKIHLQLVGWHNVYNGLAAIGICRACGIDLDIIANGLANVGRIRGRFELVDCGQDFLVVIDYAHTPDGLKNVLLTSKGLKPKRLITVFGCGGDRDKDKRQQMGEIAGEMSDYTILTTDNPRSEDPLEIIYQIEAGIKRKTKSYEIVIDRKQAIEKTLKYACSGDLILIAGKGHETYQIIGDKRFHFDDKEITEALLKRRL